MNRWRSTFCIRLLIALYAAGMLQSSTVTLIHDVYHFVATLQPTHDWESESPRRSFTHRHGGSTHSHSLFVNIALQSLDENSEKNSDLQNNNRNVEMTVHFCAYIENNQKLSDHNNTPAADQANLTGFMPKPHLPPPEQLG